MKRIPWNKGLKTGLAPTNCHYTLTFGKLSPDPKRWGNHLMAVGG